MSYYSSRDVRAALIDLTLIFKKPAANTATDRRSATLHFNMDDETKKTDIHMIPQQPKTPKTKMEKENSRRLIVVLEQACLETYKPGKTKDAKYVLLNCDDHQSQLKRLGKDVADARPDICHQVS